MKTKGLTVAELLADLAAKKEYLDVAMTAIREYGDASAPEPPAAAANKRKIARPKLSAEEREERRAKFSAAQKLAWKKRRKTMAATA